MRWRTASCFNAALTFLCRFLRPLPRLGPSIAIGSARRCFRAASFSARSFSRFLSRFLNVLIDDLSRVPYALRNLSRFPDVTCVMMICPGRITMKSMENTYMSRNFCIQSVRYPYDTGIFPGVIRGIHRHISPVMGYCRSKQGKEKEGGLRGKSAHISYASAISCRDLSMTETARTTGIRTRTAGSLVYPVTVSVQFDNTHCVVVDQLHEIRHQLIHNQLPPIS
jgi:hypothetical protein